MSYLHFGPYLFFPPVYLISPSPVSFFSGLSSLLVASTSSQLMQDFPHLPTQGNGRILIIFNQIQLFCGNLANEAVMQHISIFWPFIPVTSLPSLHRGSGPWKRTHIDIFVVSERTAQQRAPPQVPGNSELCSFAHMEDFSKAQTRNWRDVNPYLVILAVMLAVENVQEL